MRSFIKFHDSVLIKETKWVFIGNIITIITSSIFTFYSAKELGTRSYGIIALIMATVSLIQELFSFRTWEAVLRFGTNKLKEDKNQFMTIFLTLVIFDLIIFGFVFILIIFGGDIIQRNVIKESGHINEIYAYAFVTLLSFNKATFSAFLRIFKRFDINSLILAINSLGRLLFGTIFYFFSPSILSFFLAYVLAGLITFLMYLFFFLQISKKANIKIIDNIPNFKSFSNILLEVRSFLTTTYWVSSLKSISTRLTPLIISRFLSVDIVGMYKLVRDITTIFTLAITDTIYNIAYPRIAKKINDDIKEIKNTILFLVLFGIIGILGYSGVLFVFGDTLLRLFFEQYISILAILHLVTIELFLLIHPSWMIPLIMCSGLEKHNLISRIINSFFLVIFLVIFTPQFALVGVEISIILSSLIYVVYLAVISLGILRRPHND